MVRGSPAKTLSSHLQKAPRLPDSPCANLWSGLNLKAQGAAGAGHFLLTSGVTRVDGLKGDWAHRILIGARMSSRHGMPVTRGKRSIGSPVVRRLSGGSSSAWISPSIPSVSIHVRVHLIQHFGKVLVVASTFVTQLCLVTIGSPKHSRRHINCYCLEVNQQFGVRTMSGFPRPAEK